MAIYNRISSRFVLLLLISGLIAFSTIVFVFAVIPHQTSEAGSKTLIINNGDGLSLIAAKLKKHDLIKSQYFFKWFSIAIGKTTAYKRGEYLIEENVSVLDLVKLLDEGKTRQIPVTFPEGMRMSDMFSILRNNGYQNAGEYDQLSSDSLFIQTVLNGIDVTTLEGFLFPDTYTFPKETSEAVILKALVRNFFRKLPNDYSHQASKVGLTFYEAVILASIIEKETSVPSERNLISSVFHNRLRLNMRLQTDPTVIYGIKNFNGNLTRRLLRAKTPYNTYVIHGLPPTPIANPGLDSLIAAVNPVETKLTFFVAKGDGTHVFSDNYEDHKRAIEKYQKRRNPNYRSF